MNNQICPICGHHDRGCHFEEALWSDNTEQCGYYINCLTKITPTHVTPIKFTVSSDIVENTRLDHPKIYNAIVQFLIKNPYQIIKGIKYNYKFFYDENHQRAPSGDPRVINAFDLMKNYPDNIIDRIDHILLNLEFLFPQTGKLINPTLDSYNYKHIFYTESDNYCEEILTIVEYMKALNYVLVYENCCDFRISLDGWKRINELKKHAKESNQGFIAMRFSNETTEIKKCFQEAIQSCGYLPRAIDEKEHNNQIVPEIFYEISKSKFLVVDVTYPNYGAYYEAGYGTALGKEVIICCRKTEFADSKTKPHFDISQKNMVIWENEEDLVRRLERRIEATVGKNQAILS